MTSLTCILYCFINPCPSINRYRLCVHSILRMLFVDSNFWFLFFFLGICDSVVNPPCEARASNILAVANNQSELCRATRYTAPVLADSNLASAWVATDIFNVSASSNTTNVALGNDRMSAWFDLSLSYTRNLEEPLESFGFLLSNVDEAVPDISFSTSLLPFIDNNICEPDLFSTQLSNLVRIESNQVLPIFHIILLYSCYYYCCCCYFHYYLVAKSFFFFFDLLHSFV